MVLLLLAGYAPIVILQNRNSRRRKNVIFGKAILVDVDELFALVQVSLVIRLFRGVLMGAARRCKLI